MAKTNFTKVEESLSEGLRKMQVDSLLDSTGKTRNAEQVRERGRLIVYLQREIKYLQAQGQNPYETLKIDKELLKKFSDNPDTMSEQDWEKIKDIKKTIMSSREERNTQNDEDLVEQQRLDQKTKRFNVNKKWMPLS